MIIPLDIIQVFQDRWPEMTFYVVLIAFVVFATWRITKFYYTKFKSLENKVQHSDCQRHAIAIKSVEDKVQHSDCQRHAKAIDSFDVSTEKILTKIDYIEKALIAKDPNMFITFAQSHSPYKLNQDGIDLMKESGADIIFEQQKDDLVRQIEEMAPATAYDVEQNAYKVLILNTDKSWFIPLKEYVFNSPVFRGNNINLDAICMVMSLPLRDYYLEKHSEVD
jgi:hypothetical protein